MHARSGRLCPPGEVRPALQHPALGTKDTGAVSSQVLLSIVTLILGYEELSQAEFDARVRVILLRAGVDDDEVRHRVGEFVGAVRRPALARSKSDSRLAMALVADLLEPLQERIGELVRGYAGAVAIPAPQP